MTYKEIVISKLLQYKYSYKIKYYLVLDQQNGYKIKYKRYAYQTVQ